MFRIISLISVVLLLGACSSTGGVPSSNMSVNHNAKHGVTTIGHGVQRIIENTYWKLPKNARTKHTETVYFVINNLEDGKVMQWHDTDSSTMGSVKVLMTESYGGSYCRLLDSKVDYGSKTRSLQEYACSRNWGRTWTFRPY